MIKALNVSLGLIGAAQLNPLGIAVPDVAPGVYATGYYTDEITGIEYYYNAPLDQWYYYAAGYIYALGTSWQPSPSPMIDLIGGVDTLRFILDFYYVGPVITQTFKATLGGNVKSGGFPEWSDYVARKDLLIPGRSAPVHHSNFYVDIVIPANGHNGEDGAAYCKKDQFFVEEGKDTTPYYYDVCHIVEAEGEFTKMTISKFEKVV